MTIQGPRSERTPLLQDSERSDSGGQQSKPLNSTSALQAAARTAKSDFGTQVLGSLHAANDYIDGVNK